MGRRHPGGFPRLQGGGQRAHIAEHPGGLDLAAGQVIRSALPGQDEDGVHPGARAAGDVGVQPVPHQEGLLRGEAGALHGQADHVRLGFAHHRGFTPGGPGEHFTHAAAVGHRAVPGGAHPVRVGGKKVYPPAKQDTGVLQLLESQLSVKPHQKAVDPVLQLVGDGNARLAQLSLEAPGAKGIAQLIGGAGLQVGDEGVGGGEEILLIGRNAHAGQLVHIVGHRAGGVVGEEKVPAALRPDLPQKGQSGWEQGAVQIERSVQIQQEQPLVRELGHGLPPCPRGSAESITSLL